MNKLLQERAPLFSVSAGATHRGHRHREMLVISQGSQHADRDAQFEHINRKAQSYLKQGEPVISVDTKKKELVGDFKNAGRKWQLKGQPEPVRVSRLRNPRARQGQGGALWGL